MTKVKLVDETIIKASNVEVVNGILKITTSEKTVEELATIFSDKEKTNHITLMTLSGRETGFKIGFTSFAGITYDADGNKTIEMFQPIDASEARISNAEGVANATSLKVDRLNTEMAKAQNAMTTITNEMNTAQSTMASLTEEITNAQLALVEVYELMA